MNFTFEVAPFINRSGWAKDSYLPLKNIVFIVFNAEPLERLWLNRLQLLLQHFYVIRESAEPTHYFSLLFREHTKVTRLLWLTDYLNRPNWQALSVSESCRQILPTLKYRWRVDQRLWWITARHECNFLAEIKRFPGATLMSCTSSMTDAWPRPPELYCITYILYNQLCKLTKSLCSRFQLRTTFRVTCRSYMNNLLNLCNEW